MAIDRHAPEYLILSILKANVEAASVRNKNNALPLHHAAEQNFSANIIVQLIKAYPEALDIQDANKNTPRDFPQSNDLTREALMRPTACWIEDTEKEEYLDRVVERRADLRRKMAKVEEAIEKSNKRMIIVSNTMTKLEPRIDKIDCAISKSEGYQSQLANMKSIMCNHLQKIRERLAKLEEAAAENHKTEVNMMNSILKREYVDNVKSTYEVVMKLHQQLKKDVTQMKAIVEKGSCRTPKKSAS